MFMGRDTSPRTCVLTRPTRQAVPGKRAALSQTWKQREYGSWSEMRREAVELNAWSRNAPLVLVTDQKISMAQQAITISGHLSHINLASRSSSLF